MSDEQTPAAETAPPTLTDRLDALHAKTGVSNQDQIMFRELVEIVQAMNTPAA